jgi:hypothetical protein
MMAEIKVIIRGSIILNALLLAACMVLGVLLCGKARRVETEQRVDTLMLANYPVKPEPQAGRAFTTIDTLWRTGKIHWPLWSIQYVEHRHSAVKVLTMKPDADSTLVHSATYYAPSGFRLYFEKDSLRLDTFPQPKLIPELTKRKLWHWEIASGVTYRDTTFQPIIRFGGELGSLKIGKVEVSWKVIETEWEFRLPLALSSYLIIRF